MPTTRAAASNYVNSASSIAVSKPSGTVEGDLLVAFIRTLANRTFTAPSGWTQIANGSGVNFAMFWRRAGVSEPASYTFSVGSATNIVGMIAAVEQGSDPTNGQTSSQSTASTNTQTLPSVTADEDGLLLAFFTVDASYFVSSPPSGMVQRLFSSVAYSRAIYDESIVAGATGARALVWSSSSGVLRGAMTAIGNANTAPNAPILTSPVGNAVVDRTAQIDLEGSFSDPDDGDELSAFEVEYRTQAGTGLVQPGQEAGSGQTFTHTIPANTLTAGGWQWRARTWDAQGAQGVWSGWENFQAASPPPAPVITAPTDEGTVDSDPFTVTWTAPNQTHYQVRTVADSGGSPDTGTVHEDTGEVASTSSRSASVPFPTNNLVVHVQVRVKYGGLWSPWDSHSATVSYTPPETPTCVVRANVADEPVTGWPAGAALAVDITNPSGDTATASNDLRRQQSRDGTVWTDEAGTVDAYNTVARGLAPDATYVDVAVASRMHYRYAVVAIGDNTTRTVGAWEDGT